MATIKDVARLAGVSVATVSRVINNSPKASEASRLAVHSAMESLSYHPNANARALAQQTTETVGLIVGDVSDPFFGAMVKAVEQVAYQHQILIDWQRLPQRTKSGRLGHRATDPPSLCCVGRPCQNHPGCRFSLINETNARYGADQPYPAWL